MIKKNGMFRRHGVNTRFYQQVLKELFARGASRVWIDCTKDNWPSLKAQLRAGFRPIGEIAVCGLLLGGRAIWWRPARLPPLLQ